ncbi:MAG: helix-turn-helix domain-containing protein [Bacteroidales bacterium]
MSIQERKEREKEALRGKIMEAASRILVREGYEGTTMRKVAAAIDYSPRTLYLYFRDKDSLLMEIVEEGFAATIRHRESILDRLDHSRPEQIFGMQVAANIDLALQSPHMYRAIVYLIQHKGYPPGPFQRKVIEAIRYDIELCHLHSRKPLEDAGMKTDLLLAFVRAFNLQLIQRDRALSPRETERAKTQCLQMILKGILQL